MKEKCMISLKLRPLFELLLCDFPSGDCTWSGGGRSVWCWSHGGAGEVPPVSSWMKGLDVWPPRGAPQGADRGPRWSLEASCSPQATNPRVPVTSSRVHGGRFCTKLSPTRLSLPCMKVIWETLQRRDLFYFWRWNDESIQPSKTEKECEQFCHNSMWGFNAFSLCCVIVNWTS